MNEVHASEFASLALQVSPAARANGLAAPTFRTPPKKVGALRTLKRLSDDAVVVAIAVRGRSASEVVNDMVDGVLSANCVSVGRARQRSALLDSVRQLRQDRLRAA